MDLDRVESASSYFIYLIKSLYKRVNVAEGPRFQINCQTS